MEGFLKINVDAAFEENSRTSATGVAIRDDKVFCIADV
jgi:hypothetical protein